MKSDNLKSSSPTTKNQLVETITTNKTIRNVLIAVVIVGFIYVFGSYEYSVSGEYTNNDTTSSFEQHGGAH